MEGKDKNRKIDEIDFVHNIIPSACQQINSYMFIIVKRRLNELLWQTKKLCVTRLTGFSEAKKIFKVNLAIQFAARKFNNVLARPTLFGFLNPYFPT